MNRQTRYNDNAPARDYYLPAVDVIETKDELVLLTDMPGVDPQALEVTVEDGVLTLVGRVSPGRSEREQPVLEEFATGDYYRQFRIPREFVPDGIDASVRNGVVTIRIPRDERSKPRKIQLRVEETPEESQKIRAVQVEPSSSPCGDGQ